MVRATRALVIDDHLLLQILLGEEHRYLRRKSAVLYTTGLWYHRLCRAIRTSSVTGALSRSLGASGEEVGAAAVEAIAALPDELGLCSLRDLAWPMARLIDDDVRLNLLSLEALAAAEHLGAHLHLAASNENPPLIDAAKTRGVPLTVIS